MRIPGWKTARLAGRWVRGRISRGALILGYHRVADPAADPYGLCVSPRHFDEQMAVLRTGSTPVSLADLVRQLTEDVPGREQVAVTFDDGYADVVQNALPLLQRHDVPATMFVVSGSVGQTFWWDELAHLILATPRDAHDRLLACADLEPGRDGRLQDAGGSADTLRTVHRHLEVLPAPRRSEVLDRLRAVAGSTPEVPPDNRAVTASELAQLAQTKLVEIGSHTASHAALADLPAPVQLDELRGSRCVLADMTGRPVQDLSYPHGSLSQGTRDLARAAGYRCACGSQPDIVRRHGDTYHLPRFWVPDWDGERFARWLRRWQ